MVNLLSGISVPAVDSSANGDMSDVIGNKSDTHEGDSVMAKTTLIEEHMHTANKVIPSGQAGITLTTHADDWVLGGYVEMVAASGIGSDFDFHWITIEDVSADGVYEIVLYAVTTEIGRKKITIANFANLTLLSPVPILTDLVVADTQIQAKIMSSNDASEDTMVISLDYHIY